MSFNEKYSSIKMVIEPDLIKLEKDIAVLFESKNPINDILSEMLSAPSKRLRPVLGFLLLRGLFGEVTAEQRDVLLAVELIHNATLIHDDVIDSSDKRRNQETINKKFDSNFAVVIGDFLLSIALEKIISTNSAEVFQICTMGLKSTCQGEISQYFSKNAITTIDEYIEKSKNKTALLFEIGNLSSVVLSSKSTDELKKIAIDFSQNFGIAFQIRDDLINVLENKTSSNDLASGIYTAPVIYAYKENKNILGESDVLSAIKQTQGIEKTKYLMDNYFNRAIAAIDPIGDSLYKQGIFNLVEALRTNL